MVNNPESYIELKPVVSIPQHVDEDNVLVSVGDRVAICYGGKLATGTIGLRTELIVTFDHEVDGGVASATLQGTTRMMRLGPAPDPTVVPAA